MALLTIRIGGIVDAIQYDDAGFDSAIETSAPLKSGTPVDLNDVVRLEDLTTSAGFSESKSGIALLSSLNNRQAFDRHRANFILETQVFS